MSEKKVESELKLTCKFSKEEEKKIFNQSVLNYSVEPVILQTLKLNKMKNCGICDKELSQEDVSQISKTDLMLTCREHNKYREYSNSQVPKMELGIIKEYSLKWKKCEICECDLTKDDIDSFSKQTVNPTCKKHRIAYNWWQIDLAKDWFEYCDHVGFDLNYSEANSKGFQDWRFEKYKK